MPQIDIRVTSPPNNTHSSRAHTPTPQTSSDPQAIELPGESIATSFSQEQHAAHSPAPSCTSDQMREAIESDPELGNFLAEDLPHGIPADVQRLLIPLSSRAQSPAQAGVDDSVSTVTHQPPQNPARLRPRTQPRGVLNRVRNHARSGRTSTQGPVIIRSANLTNNQGRLIIRRGTQRFLTEWHRTPNEQGLNNLQWTGDI
jgi:hypothetical protein